MGRQSPQGVLFRPDHALRGHVGKGSFYGLLGENGRTWFPDEAFAELYHEDFGRPSVPPSQLAVALLLQAHDTVSDEEAIARSAYDLRWKVALGLELDEKLCAKSTLQRFRAQLVLHEATGQIFDRGIEACRAAGLLKRTTLSAAIDTTPILGRGAVRDTFNLVSDGIRHVVEEACQLKSWEREETVEAEGLSRHFGASFKGSLDLDWSDEEERRAVVGQLGIRQARYFGKTKTGFQVALAATVANLMLVVAISEPASSVALTPVVLSALGVLTARELTARTETLEMAPSRPGF
ncbi:MAG: hypothetical protein CL910_20250 [Deltaproteobacteria bacterium]|nr:hypothetical protein [Deltaproteobacteria bacterium]